MGIRRAHRLPFNYDAHTTEFESLGRVPVLKARLNTGLHMTVELK